MIIKAVFNILSKVLLGFILFFLITGFIIVPFILWLAIPVEGKNIFKRPMHIQSVRFNPFLLQLTLNGFEVLDDRSHLMIGFDKLCVVISPFDLFKKIYHVKKVQLDALSINAQLLAGNKLDLLGMIPVSPVVNSSGSSQKSIDLPTVIVDSIELKEGKINFTDQTINPPVSLAMSLIRVQITNLGTNPQLQAKIKFRAHLNDKGRIAMEALIKPMAKPLALETTVSLNDYAMNVLSPYVGKYTGRELKDGKLYFNMDYEVENNKIVGNHTIVIQKFAFGKQVQSKDALHLPFGLAVALLQDPRGKINITLPLSGDMSDPKFEYFHLVSQVFRNFLFKLVSKPFTILGSVLGASDTGSDELGYVRFSPGKIDLSDSQKKRLTKLITGLKERPKLLLEINGGYDPGADWKEIQASIFIKDYDELKKTSTRSEAKNYQLLYQRRFGIRALWALAKKYKQGLGHYDDHALNTEIKRQLIENAPPDRAALTTLAKARAKIVDDFFVSKGFDLKRLSIGQTQATKSSMGYVPTPFTLTVFDHK